MDQFRNGWAVKRISSCNLPEQELATFVGPSRPVIDQVWTSQDEAWLKDIWDNSKTKSALFRIGRKNQELLKLWRLSCTLMRCSPVAIISPQHGLLYDGVELTHEISPRDHGECSLWSEAFCKALSSLIVHSFWRGNAKLLSTCIQYSVVCRTDDRQPWKMAMDPSSCLDMENMRDIAVSHRSRHIHLAQTDFNASQTAHGRVLSLEYEFISYLGSIIEKPFVSYAQKQSDSHPHVYAVRTADLNTILHALNTFKPNGFPLFTHSDVFLSACQSVPLHYVFPRENQLCELHMRAFLHETRMAYRNVRAHKWTPGAPRVFLPGVASVDVESSALESRLDDGRESVREVITILDDDDKPRLGLPSSRSNQWEGPSHHQHGGKRRRQQQHQSPDKKKKKRNKNHQRQGTTPGPFL